MLSISRAEFLALIHFTITDIYGDDNINNCCGLSTNVYFHSIFSLSLKQSANFKIDFFPTHFWFEVKMIKTTTHSMILPHVVVKKLEKKKVVRVGLIKICFYTQYKTVLLDRLFLLDIFHIPLRCNRTEMREIIQCTSFVLINGTVTFIHFFKNKINHFWPESIPVNENHVYRVTYVVCIVIFGQHCKL